jgi:hypothetical protein
MIHAGVIGISSNNTNKTTYVAVGVANEKWFGRPAQTACVQFLVLALLFYEWILAIAPPLLCENYVDLHTMYISITKPLFNLHCL